MTEIGKGGFLHPEKILKDLSLIKPGMEIADFGCGAGYFCIHMAEMVGTEGKVNAIDILDTALEAVRSTAKLRGILNINLIKSNLEEEGGSKLRDESQDLVMVSNILFQSYNKVNIVREAKRILKKGGGMIIIEWLPDVLLGPKEGNKVLPGQIKELAQSEGFTLKQEFSAGQYHYGLVFTK